MTEKMTEGPKIQKAEDQKYCFVPNIGSNLHLVDMNTTLIGSFGTNSELEILWHESINLVTYPNPFNI